MVQHMNLDRTFVRSSGLGVRMTAIVEAILILAAIVVIDMLAGSGERFMHVSPHPFWIAVLLISAQYGAVEGVLTAILASAALLIGNLPPIGFGEDPYNYAVNLAFNPAMWLAVSLAVGELRSQANRRAQTLSEELESARSQELKLIAAAERLSQANRALEERVAGQLRTVASIYEASRAVEQLGTGDVLLGISDLVRASLNPRKFSLYLINNQQLEAVLNDGWQATDRYTRVFTNRSPMFREIVVNRRFLCVTNAKDMVTLTGEGILAGPLCSEETGETLGMLKVELMDALEFNMTAVESFRVICRWIGTSFARARTFEHAAQRNFVGTGNILSASAEQPLTQFLKSMAIRSRSDLAAINISVQLPDSTPTETRYLAYRSLRQKLSNCVRQTDIACERSASGFEYVILAPGCPYIEARRLADKIRIALAEAIPGQANATISTTAVPVIECEMGVRA